MARTNFIALQAAVSSVSGSTSSIDFSYALAFYYSNNTPVVAMAAYAAEKHFETVIKPAIMRNIEIINENIPVNIALIAQVTRAHFLMRTAVATGGVFDPKYACDSGYAGIFTTPAKFLSPDHSRYIDNNAGMIRLLHDVISNNFYNSDLRAF